MNLKLNTHLKEQKAKKMIGSPFFITLNQINGLIPTRRDDIESLLFTLMFLVRGETPWRYDPFRETKDFIRKRNTITSEEICEGLPTNILRAYKHAKALKFEESPDYDFLELQFE